MRAKNAIKAEKVAKKLTPQVALKELKKQKQPTNFFSTKYDCSVQDIFDVFEQLIEQGYLVCKMGDVWVLQKEPQQGTKHIEYVSREDNTYIFGFIGDTHIGSKYCRHDVLQSVYKHFGENDIDRVFHAGNWIEGESHFNKYDIEIYGMDNQCKELAKRYPKIDTVTYAVAGDDHEGWYAQREGIDIGKHAETIMIENGRSDWEDLGYMEAFVPLVNSNTGKKCMLLLMHPGGGSAYAVSYRPQKLVESFTGGEKPAVLLIGHYHKMSYNHFRNVHCIQVGCTQDQTPFLRKKSIHVDLGGGICKLTQDPRTGAIESCQVQFFTYMNKGHYNDRWNKAHKPKRYTV